MRKKSQVEKQQKKNHLETRMMTRYGCAAGIFKVAGDERKMSQSPVPKKSRRKIKEKSIITIIIINKAKAPDDDGFRTRRWDVESRGRRARNVPVSGAKKVPVGCQSPGMGKAAAAAAEAEVRRRKWRVRAGWRPRMCGRSGGGGGGGGRRRTPRIERTDGRKDAGTERDPDEDEEDDDGGGRAGVVTPGS